MKQQEQLFHQLHSENQQRFARIARSYAGANEKQDLEQEIWYQVWRALESFEGNAAVNTWAYRVALNTAISYVRKDVKQPERVALGLDDEGTTLGCSSEVFRLVQDFLQKLSALDKGLFLMYLDGFSQQQIAKTMGLTTSNVGVKTSRLKQQFEQEYVE